MKLQVTIEIDSDYDNCEAALENLEVAVQEHEGISIHVAGDHYEAAILAVTELPAVGRPPEGST